MAGAVTSAAALAEGDKVSQFVKIGAKQIPLPDGDWTVAGLGTQEVATTGIGAYGAVQSAVLFLIRDNRILAMLELNTNAITAKDGWGWTNSCKPGGKLMITTRYKTGWETSCLFVVPTVISADQNGPAAWKRAVEFAKQRNLSMAELWLTAGFRVSDRQDIVDARYHFNPALTLGATASLIDKPSEWTSDAIRDDPLRLEAANVMLSWAFGFDEWIERGLRNQITGPVGPLPGTAAYAGEAPHADGKLMALDNLLREGRIGWDDYTAQAAEVPTEAPVLQQSLLPPAVEKNISFRTFGTFVDYAIAYVVTADPVISTGVALTINSTDSVWFVANDNFWDDYFAKLSNHNAERVVDFAYIGTEVTQ